MNALPASQRPTLPTVRVRAPAKLNLHLAVLARESDGYHQLETVFCALDLADRLEVRHGPPGIGLDIDGPDLGRPEENLVHEAARAFYRATSADPAVEIRLEKRIPAGAGLGGGSSDAAATLRALNVLHGAPLSEGALLDAGAAVGSDVAFFLTASPLALAWGRGQRLLALPSLPVTPVLLVVPDFGVATAEAYRWLDQDRGRTHDSPGAQLFRPEAFADWHSIARYARNDFEATVFGRFPGLARLREMLGASGAWLTRLTGSGSALFAVYPDTASRARGARELLRRRPEITLIETVTAAHAAAASTADDAAAAPL